MWPTTSPCEYGFFAHTVKITEYIGNIVTSVLTLLRHRWYSGWHTVTRMTEVNWTNVDIEVQQDKEDTSGTVWLSRQTQGKKCWTLVRPFDRYHALISKMLFQLPSKFTGQPERSVLCPFLMLVTLQFKHGLDAQTYSVPDSWHVGCAPRNSWFSNHIGLHLSKLPSDMLQPGLCCQPMQSGVSKTQIYDVRFRQYMEAQQRTSSDSKVREASGDARPFPVWVPHMPKHQTNRQKMYVLSSRGALAKVTLHLMHPIWFCQWQPLITGHSQ